MKNRTKGIFVAMAAAGAAQVAHAASLQLLNYDSGWGWTDQIVLTTVGNQGAGSAIIHMNGDESNSSAGFGSLQAATLSMDFYVGAKGYGNADATDCVNVNHY